MKHRLATWVCAATAVVLCADAMSADSRYASIVERNVFGLKPPPPPPGPEDTKPPPSNITLTGIITLGGKRALMTTPPVGGKPGAPATPESYILKEGEIQGPIEVISIDEVNFVVKVRNSGQEQTLDFKNNGPKLVAGPPPAAAPGAAAGVKPMPGTMPGINPGGMVRPMPTQTPAGGVAVPMPNFDRNVRTTTPGTTGAGYPGAAVGTSLTGYGASGVNPHTTVNPVHNLTAEEQALMVEVERERTRDRVLSGRMPPLPPTPYTPAGSPGSITPGTTPGQGTQPGGQ